MIHKTPTLKVTGQHYTALHWQKEATDKSSKSEKVMFLDWT